MSYWERLLVARSAPSRSRPGGALFLQPMGGLGDTIYTRPLALNQLESYDQVYVRTPWPELYQDTPVRPVYYPRLALRTQAESMDRWGGEWSPAPDVKPRVVRYLLHAQGVNVVQDLERSFRKDGRYAMGLPTFPAPWPLEGDTRPVAIVRPPTVRKEWACPARNCHPAYMAQAAELLMGLGFRVVTLGHLVDGLEWLEADPVPADLELLHAELDVAELCGLVQRAAVCVGSPGFLLPMALAYRTPMVCVAGGFLRYNRREVLTDPRMPLEALEWLEPDQPCHCTDRHHDCDKTIKGFADRFLAALGRLALPSTL